MSSSKPTAMLDFLLDKEDCKSFEESLRTTMFSNMNCSPKFKEEASFKEELFSDDLSINWKTENDFNMDELLLGSYLESSDGVEDEGPGCCPNAGPSPTAGLALKEEDFAPFKDFVSLPFETVMDPLDMAGFEVGSDSGVSTDNNIPDVMLSPLSGVMSPDPQGDISLDTLDAVSDVSSTSDLGSLGSGGSSPFQGGNNGGSGLPPSFTFIPLQGDTGSPIISGTVYNGGEEEEQEGDVKGLPLSLEPLLPDKTGIFVAASSPSPLSHHRFVVTSPQVTKLTNNNTTSPQTPSIATRSIRLATTHHTPRIVKTLTTANTTVSTSTTRSPILAKVRLESGGVVTSPKIVTTSSGVMSSSPKIVTTSRTNSPQTIVVTQGGKGNPLLRGGALLKAGTGRSILLPVNVNDLNQVRTIKIISAGSSNGCSSTSSVIRPSGIRTLVSTVRPASSSSSSSISTSSSSSTSISSITPSRTTFYTTSKGSDGRSLLKVTPTAFVAPTSHHHAQVVAGSGSSVASTRAVGSVGGGGGGVSYSSVKEEMSDDDDDGETPLPNQELVLTGEERRLMQKEGLVLPSRYPLTKQEERDLKRIRRKIRNKISAQDSRKRKKEYVDGLEDRVKNCTDENQQLQKRIKTLEKQNETLVAQLKKFQGLVGGGLYHNRPHNHTSTALMMLILSAALFVVPSLRSQDGKGENELTRNTKMPSAGHSRTLLEARNNALNMDAFPATSDEEEMDPLSFSHALSDHDYAPVAKKIRLDTPTTFFSAPNVDKTLSGGAGDPPDSIGGLAAMIGAMFDRLGSNWTDPGGHIGAASLNRTPPHGAQTARSSVVVNLNHGRRMRDDIELE